MIKYIKTFLFGGILFSLIKYLSSVADPKYSAIIAAFPIGLISSVLMTNKKQLISYINGYEKSIFILLIIAVVYKTMIYSEYSFKISLMTSLIIWLLLHLFNNFVLNT